ncbi:MAG: FlgD immunoglobulin-like domain containing protein [Candidatus Kapaibacteriota bacterium]
MALLKSIYFLFFISFFQLTYDKCCFGQPPFRNFLDTTDKKIAQDTLILPGPAARRFSPEQDSAYLRAKMLSIPASARLYLDMKLLEQEILRQKKLHGLSEQEIAKKNLQIPQEVLMPLPQEISLYQYGLMQSQSIPFVPIMKPFGAKIPLSSIGSFLGFVEDVSPWLEYDLDVETDVTVAIYNERALMVATIVDKIQPPGHYRYYWNGRDNNGKQLPRGDYIGEIRIGKTKYIRKRIRLD